MRRALACAQAQLGRTSPNPSVGCVIVARDRILAEAATGGGGRSHAEEIALGLAGDTARDADAYVTLEPCAARTSGAASCADRLIASGVRRVVIACPEPNPVSLGGAERLAAAGVSVVAGVLRAEAEALNIGFFTRLRTGRPWLAESTEGNGFDARFDRLPGESHEAALDRLGAAGLTRVYVMTGSAEAALLRARNLLPPA
ncbi:hypothetical protein GC169_10980 [bacterium]|nr:hypothetical protein [bacterium]